MKTGRIIRRAVLEVAAGGSVKDAVGKILRVLENAQVGQAVEAVKAEIEAGNLGKNAKAVEAYIREMYPHYDDLRVEVALQMLQAYGVLSEAVNERSSYVLLVPVERIPAGSRVEIVSASVVPPEEGSEEEPKLKIEIRTTEPVMPLPAEEKKPEGELVPPVKTEQAGDAATPPPELPLPAPAGEGEKKETEPQVLTASITVDESELDLIFDLESEEEPEEEEDLGVTPLPAEGEPPPPQAGEGVA